MTEFLSPVPDYTSVPTQFLERVCNCGKRDAFSKQTLPEGYDWWVCYECYLPAPLNALNARLIRECMMCEEPYWIATYPDKMDLCSDCA